MSPDGSSTICRDLALGIERSGRPVWVDHHFSPDGQYLFLTSASASASPGARPKQALGKIQRLTLDGKARSAIRCTKRAGSRR